MLPDSERRRRGVSLSRCLLVVAAAAAGGCGDAEPTARLVGSVRIGGSLPERPLMVVVENRERGISAAAAVDAAGRFDILTAPGRGVPAGRYRVAVMPQPSPLGDIADALKPGRPGAENSRAVAAKFGSTDTSGLSVDVTLPKTELAIDIP